MPKIYTIKFSGEDYQVQILSASFTNDNQDSYTGGPTNFVTEDGDICECYVVSSDGKSFMCHGLYKLSYDGGGFEIGW